MFWIIEVLGGFLGLGLMLYGLGNGDTYLVAGLVIMVLSYIISAICYATRAWIMEDDVKSGYRSASDPEVRKAKADALGAICRTTLVAGSTYKSTKKAVKEIGNPDTWGKI